MEWNDTVELTLDGIAQGGEGVGRWEGRVVFASGGLPGERVRVRLSERHDAYARGEVVEVLAASPERVAPQLPGADHMPWQHIAYPAQLRFKRQILAEQLSKIGGLTDVEVAETLPSARPWGYRNNARVHIAEGRLGYHIAGTRELRPLDADPLLLPALNDSLAALQAVLTPDDTATEAVVRASETHGYTLAALRGPGNLRDLARRWFEECPPLAGITLSGGASLGADRLIEELDGIAFSLQPMSFFQVNLASAEELLRLVREGLALRGGERLLDLYSGVGTFALPLARAAREVVAVEEFGGAIADADVSARENGIANVQFVEGRTELVLERLEGPFDGIVLDPPRRGSHPRALEGLLRLAPPCIVYVSCQPATLARDLRALAGDYRVAHVQPIDLFPQTPHIECVVTLERTDS